MIIRPSAVIAAALALLLCGCPPKSATDGGTNPDGGDGGPNVLPEDKCSGGCSINQKCDPVRRICVDGCGGCDAGVCVKNATTMAFECAPVVTSCQGNACETGQIACLAGACTCLQTTRAAEDSCAPESKWCSGGSCVAPKRYQECNPGGAACPAGHLCSPVFSGNTPGTCDTSKGETPCLCTKACTNTNECERGEGCSSDGCLPVGLFRDQECMQQVAQADGGVKKLTVPVGNVCLLKDGAGQPTETTPTGNCHYATLSFYDEPNYSIANCRPPGAATLGQTCKQDFAPAAVATTCNTGMECALTRGGDQGVCLTMCNAAPTYPGFNPTPACATDESCANLYRREDQNAVLGVCMKKCNVFDPAKNTCANIGTAPASCVPTSADGRFAVSTDGSGICVPQRVTIATEGMPCDEQDPFKGAACGSGQICSSPDVNSPAICYAVCDTSCAGATPPARCATEPSATCQGGKKCTTVTSTSGAILGFCK